MGPREATCALLSGLPDGAPLCVAPTALFDGRGLLRERVGARKARGSSGAWRVRRRPRDEVNLLSLLAAWTQRAERVGLDGATVCVDGTDDAVALLGTTEFRQRVKALARQEAVVRSDTYDFEAPVTGKDDLAGYLVRGPFFMQAYVASDDDTRFLSRFTRDHSGAAVHSTARPHSRAFGKLTRGLTGVRDRGGASGAPLHKDDHLDIGLAVQAELRELILSVVKVFEDANQARIRLAEFVCVRDGSSETLTLLWATQFEVGPMLVESPLPRSLPSETETKLPKTRPRSAAAAVELTRPNKRDQKPASQILETREESSGVNKQKCGGRPPFFPSAAYPSELADSRVYLVPEQEDNDKADCSSEEDETEQDVCRSAGRLPPQPAWYNMKASRSCRSRLVQALSTKLDLAQQRIAELEQALKTRQRAGEEDHALLRAADSRIKSATEICHARSRAFEEAQAENRELVRDLQAQVRLLDTEKYDMLCRLESEQARTAAAGLAYKALERQLETMQSQLEQAQARIAAHENSNVSALQAKIDSLTRELFAAKESNSDLVAQVQRVVQAKIVRERQLCKLQSFCADAVRQLSATFAPEQPTGVRAQFRRTPARSGASSVAQVRSRVSAIVQAFTAMVDPTVCKAAGASSAPAPAREKRSKSLTVEVKHLPLQSAATPKQKPRRATFSPQRGTSRTPTAMCSALAVIEPATPSAGKNRSLLG